MTTNVLPPILLSPAQARWAKLHIGDQPYPPRQNTLELLEYLYSLESPPEQPRCDISPALRKPLTTSQRRAVMSPALREWLGEKSTQLPPISWQLNDLEPHAFQVEGALEEPLGRCQQLGCHRFESDPIHCVVGR